MRNLYDKRVRQEVDELICHKQAAGLLRPHVSVNDTVLDVGCGSGYFYHSLRGMSVEYFGIDSSDALLALGRSAMPQMCDRLLCMRIEDMIAKVDHIVCTNVLSNICNYHRPLERMLESAHKTVILRESISDVSTYSYVTDNYLDRPMRVHVNSYGREEVKAFIEEYGFSVSFHVDDYTGGKPQDVIGYPHHWTFVEAVRISGEVRC
ncbi:MAG: class I SAM-dependent methyltransferase [Afipia sp.]|nr:class I SAM-dependent methyltransferase [Afipia sp.]